MLITHHRWPTNEEKLVERMILSKAVFSTPRIRQCICVDALYDLETTLNNTALSAALGLAAASGAPDYKGVVRELCNPDITDNDRFFLEMASVIGDRGGSREPGTLFIDKCISFTPESLLLKDLKAIDYNLIPTNEGNVSSTQKLMSVINDSLIKREEGAVEFAKSTIELYCI